MYTRRVQITLHEKEILNYKNRMISLDQHEQKKIDKNAWARVNKL